MRYAGKDNKCRANFLLVPVPFPPGSLPEGTRTARPTLGMNEHGKGLLPGDMGVPFATRGQTLRCGGLWDMRPAHHLEGQRQAVPCPHRAISGFGMGRVYARVPRQHPAEPTCNLGTVFGSRCILWAHRQCNMSCNIALPASLGPRIAPTNVNSVHQA